MKKILFILLGLSIAISTHAQKDAEPGFILSRTIIKISPLQFALQTFELGLENFNKNYSKSFNISGGIRTGSEYYNNGSGGNLELGYRKYAAPMKYYVRKDHESYMGIYYSLYVRGEYFKGETNNFYYGSQSSYTQEIMAIAPGFTIGVQKTLWKIILLDIYVGGGVKLVDIQSSAIVANPDSGYSIFDPGYSGIFPKIGAKIGIGL